MVRERCCGLLAMVLFSTVCVFAQSDRGYEVFVGYSNLQAQGVPNTNDFLDRRSTLQGVNGAGTLFVLGNLGLTGDVSFNRKGREVDVMGDEFSEHIDVWYFMGGPSYALPSSEHFQPFARILAGVARTNYQQEQERESSNGVDLISLFELGTTDFAMGFGGGVDVKVAERFRIRVIQFDWAPVFSATAPSPSSDKRAACYGPSSSTAGDRIILGSALELRSSRMLKNPPKQRVRPSV